MKKPDRLFDFKLHDGKYVPILSATMAAYFFQTHWMPLEMYTEEMNDKMKEWNDEDFKNILNNDFISWVSENNIALPPK